MTVAITTNRNSYVGNGAVNTYSYNFKVYVNTYMKVVVRDLAGHETVLALNTDYTVNGVGAVNGGTISLVNSSQAWLTSGFLTTGFIIIIRYLGPLIQNTDIRNQGDYFPENTEDQFDKLVKIDQQQQDSIDRSMKLPETLQATDFDPTIPTGLPGVPNVMLISDPTGKFWVIGPDVTAVAGNASAAVAAAAAAASSQTAAAASATSATASQTSATTSASSATTSATAATASAASAAASSAACPFNTVTNVNTSGSTSLSSANNGTLFDIDSTAGAVGFTLPQISSITLPFSLGFSLRVATGVVTITANASDRINGGSLGGNVTLSASGTGYFLFARAGSWALLQMGAGGGGGLTPIADQTVLGNVSGTSANPIGLTKAQLTALLGVTAPTASAIVERDANANVSVNNLIENIVSTATAAGTTTLTVASANIQQFTGTSTQIVVLPVVSTLALGQSFSIYNRSTGAVTVNSSGGNLVQTVAPGAQVIATCTAITGTSAASWDAAYSIPSGGSTSPMTTKGDLYGFDTAGNRIPVGANGTSLIADSTQALGLKWSAPQASPTASTNSAWDANKNLSANNLLDGYATTATAAGTTTLTVGSASQQYFTGSSTQTVILPVASTLVNGLTFEINNNSSGVVTVQTSGANVVQAMAANTSLLISCINTAGGTGTASWSWIYGLANNSLPLVSPLTTKGDMMTFGTAASRHAVPADYGRLIADSGQTDGWRSAVYGENNGAFYKNIIQYADFENGATTGWAMGTIGTLTNGLPTGSPTFGSGASGSLSLSAVTGGNQITDAYSMQIAQSGATVAGNMVHTAALPVDQSLRAKMLNVRLNYQVLIQGGMVLSGLSTSGMAIAAYDVSNGAFIPVNGAFNFVQGSGVGVASASLQTPYNCASIRFMIYFPNASTGSISVIVDDIYMGQQAGVNGLPGSDWVAYPASIAGVGTPTNVSFFSKRVGDRLLAKGTFTTGTVAASLITYSLGYNGVNGNVTIDTSKISIQNTSGNPGPQVGIANMSGTTNSGGLLVSATGTSTSVVYQGGNFQGTAPMTPQLGNGAYVSGATVTVAFEVPILGWSSNVQQSADNDGRQVMFVGTSGSGQSITADVTDVTATAVKDTHGGWNGSTYTVKVAGDYVFAGVLATGAAAQDPEIAKNGSLLSHSVWTTAPTANYRGGGSIIVPNCVVGDTLSLRSTATATVTEANISIMKLAGSPVVQASEKVFEQYTGNAGTALTAATTNIDFATVLKNSHGVWNGTTFTANRPGWFDIKGCVQFTSNASRGIQTYINGTIGRNIGYSSLGVVPIAGGEFLNQGDVLSFRSDASGTLLTSATYHWIGITSQG